jgi:hypothetical protein
MLNFRLNLITQRRGDAEMKIKKEEEGNQPYFLIIPLSFAPLRLCVRFFENK